MRKESGGSEGTRLRGNFADKFTDSARMTETRRVGKEMKQTPWRVTACDDNDNERHVNDSPEFRILAPEKERVGKSKPSM